MTDVLLDSSEPGPFELIRPDGRSPIVLVCDHASNRIPASLNNLRLSTESLLSHIAWDPGAAGLARKLSAKLDAPLLLSNYSRLVIDCNRPPHHPQSIASDSAGIAVPGNIAISEHEAALRQRILFDPYQQAIARVLDRRSPGSCRLLSIHSFTPCLNGRDRPWSIGVCYRNEHTWAKAMLTALQLRIDDRVGDNEPYAVESGCDYTIPEQGEKRGMPSLMLELRQDKLAHEDELTLWCDIIAASCLNTF